MTKPRNREIEAVSPAEAVAGVQSGQRVFIGGNAGTPHSLVEALVDQADRLRGVELLHILTTGEARYVEPRFAESFHCLTFFTGANVRAAVQDGRADLVPMFLHEIPRLWTGAYPLDWAFVQLSPPDKHGYCTVGVATDVVLSAIRQAKHVAAEINPQMPRTWGDTMVHVSKLSAITEVDRPLDELTPPAASDVTDRIGEHVASLIRDGDCLQTGIGAIPNAALARLHDRRHLGIHTEMLTDGIVELFRAGAVDGSRKTIMPGKIVCSFAMGTKQLYDFVDDNPLLAFHGNELTNDPFVIAKNDNVVAVNSALQVDLTGQVDADSIGEHFYSGIGGQVDFIRGASRSRGGRPVIALPSTANRGRVSRIVSELSAGAGVVTSRGDVHYVVTEYGIANLHARGVRERTEALIAIAHPDFRDELTEAARNRKLVRK